MRQLNNILTNICLLIVRRWLELFVEFLKMYCLRENRKGIGGEDRLYLRKNTTYRWFCDRKVDILVPNLVTVSAERVIEVAQVDENLLDLSCDPGKFLFRFVCNYVILARAVSFLRKYCKKERVKVEVFVIVHLVKSEKVYEKSRMFML